MGGACHKGDGHTPYGWEDDDHMMITHVVFSSLQSLRGRVSELEKKESQLVRSEHHIQAS